MPFSETSSDDAPAAPAEPEENASVRGPDWEYTPEGTSTSVVLVVGPRGGGKTTLMVPLALLAVSGERSRLRVISPVPKLAQLLGVQNTVRYGNDKTNEKFFHELRTGGRHQVLVFDEFDELCVGSVQSKTGGYCCDSLYRIVNYDRNAPYCIGIVASFRGSSDVTTNLLRAANTIFITQTSEPNVKDYFVRWFGPEWAQFLPKIPRHTFLVWHEGRFLGYVKVFGSEIRWIEPPPGWPKGGQETASSADNGQTSPSAEESEDTTEGESAPDVSGS